jgi:hypothetical protein
MQQSLSLSAHNHVHNRAQACVLLLMGSVFLIGAWSGLLNAYPVGELCFGLGMLVAAPFNTQRFLASAWLIMLIGLAGFLVFGHMLPATQFLAVHVLAIGFGLVGIWWMAHRGYISLGTLTPALLIVGVGIVEYLQAAHLTPPHFLTFALSLWFPGSGLLLLGLIALVTTLRAGADAKRGLTYGTETALQTANGEMHRAKGESR